MGRSLEALLNYVTSQLATLLSEINKKAVLWDGSSELTHVSGLCRNNEYEGPEFDHGSAKLAYSLHYCQAE